jgi:hypothetical protein
MRGGGGVAGVGSGVVGSGVGEVVDAEVSSVVGVGVGPISLQLIAITKIRKINSLNFTIIVNCVFMKLVLVIAKLRAKINDLYF